MSLTTLQTLPPAVQEVADRVLLSIKVPTLIHKLASVGKRLPSRMGTTLVMSRPLRLPTAPVPLGPSGQTPPAVPLQRVDIKATVSFYGMYVAVNNQVVLQNQQSVLTSLAELLGLSMRMTEDQLTRDLLMATAATYNCTGGQNGDLPTNVSPSDLQDVTTMLRSNDAWMILENKEGEDKFGTGPIRDAFISMSHTNLEKDLTNLPGFISKWNYPNMNSTLRSEYGSFENIRFLTSSVGAISRWASALGNTVYSMFISGMEAVGCVEQDNFSARTIFRSPIYNDALAQNLTFGYVFAEVPVILNESWITKVQCTTLRNS